MVYRARQDSLGRTVAVKVLGNERLNGTAEEQFQRECAALASLSWHPNVVAIHDASTTSDGAPALVMEYLRGGSLADRVATAGPMDVEAATRITLQLADALSAAHDAGISHRDIKPGNVLVGAEGTPKLADFGLAALATAGPDDGRPQAASVAYAAPEVLAGEPADGRSDIWALGATLHELLAGSAPFVHTSHDAVSEIIERVAHEQEPDLRDREIPDELASLVESMLAKDPDDRPSSMSELISDLVRVRASLHLPAVELPNRPHSSDRAATSDDPNPTLDTDPRPTKLRLIGLGVGLVVLIGAVATALALLRDGDARPTPSPPTTLLSVSTPVPLPQGIAVTDDAAWVTSGVDGTVAALDPGSGSPIRSWALGATPFLEFDAAALVARADPTMPGAHNAIELLDSQRLSFWEQLGHADYVTTVIADERLVYVSSLTDSTLTAYDAETGKARWQVTVGVMPSSITLDGAGHVWVANQASSLVQVFDAADGSLVTQFEIPTDLVASGPAGIWTCSQTFTTVSRLRLAGAEEVAAPIALGRLSKLAVGSAAVYATAGQGRVSEQQLEDQPPLGQGSLVEGQGAGTISRIDAASGEVTTTDVGGVITGIAYSDDGVWVQDYNGERLLLLDADTLEIIEEYDNQPGFDLSVTDDAVWITDPTNDVVWRVTAG
ncbi:MAG: Serine/threonine-protein kinase PknD [Acidimicrobiales bacterium]|nr:Serine/threonine-protein kinase PknD [Acidimicrobiales bacterium]